jgi:hypothetical protein
MAALKESNSSFDIEYEVIDAKTKGECLFHRLSINFFYL